MSHEMQMRAELQRSYRLQDFAAPGVLMRERSFVRPPSHIAHHNQMREHQKRRSMILTNSRGKPSLEIYRPPGVRADGGGGGGAAVPAAAAALLQQQQQQQQNKLNVHAKEFTMFKTSNVNSPRSTMALGYGLQHSRSTAHVTAAAAAAAGQTLPQHYRPAQPLPLLASASSGNIMHVQNGPRVHFKLPQQTTPEKKLHNGGAGKQFRPAPFAHASPGLQRSKSLTSADALASGMAALGLAADAGDLGHFPQDIQDCIDRALEDPNSVPSRTLMDAVGHLVGRAVESPRYALPAARRCIAVVERENSETFLESLLNTCRQWYHDRDKVLSAVVSGGRPRLMAFLSFLLEMYCQLRRRAIQRREPAAAASPGGGGGGGGGAGGAAPPGRVLLKLICLCCEDCIRQPVPSPSDTENLFFVLTYIGRDLETQLPAELEALLSAVRDAFLNTSAAPSIRKTLLQLIELHASRWQLPGCAVLYYYPSSK